MNQLQLVLRLNSNYEIRKEIGATEKEDGTTHLQIPFSDNPLKSLVDTREWLILKEIMARHVSVISNINPHTAGLYNYREGNPPIEGKVWDFLPESFLEMGKVTEENKSLFKLVIENQFEIAAMFKRIDVVSIEIILKE